MSSPSKIRLREARKDDVRTFIPIMIEAFRGRAMNEALFPERLRIQPGDADEIAFRAERCERRYEVREEEEEKKKKKKKKAQQHQDGPNDHPRQHYIVAVTEEEDGGGTAGGTIVGYAEWMDCAKDPSSEGNGSERAGTEEERKAKQEREAELKAERIAAAPRSLDLEAVAVLERETVKLERTLKEALGEEGFANSWCLDAIGVDPAHQRKGIGRMLMQYGAERAEKEGKNVRFMASASGAKMYRALGYEEVGSLEILGGMEYAFVRRAKK